MATSWLNFTISLRKIICIKYEDFYLGTKQVQSGAKAIFFKKLKIKHEAWLHECSQPKEFTLDLLKLLSLTIVIS